MKVRDVMTKQVIRIGAQEPVEVAARSLTHYNIGILPVCGGDGRVCGVLTDRDLVTRCIAAGRSPATTKVQEIMTGRVIAVTPDMDAAMATHLMGREQVRRLPVVENGRLCGIVSLGDVAGEENYVMDAADALAEITANVCKK